MLLTQSVHHTKSEPKCGVVQNGAAPIRFLNADRLHFDAVPLRIFHDRCRRIKTHRLIVDQTRVKLGGAVHFQIGAAVGENGKANGVGFRKTIERERCDRVQHLFDHVGRDVVARHRFTKFYADAIHSFFRTMKAEGAAQFLRLVAGKVGHDHGDLEHLLLKQRNAESAAKDRF